ncbi:MAG: glycoside hydrolase family 32 protein [Phycisphaerales bacterium]|nr:glycoside hydrolase family 32 protein [Phycisphaerales bacterium]
MNDPNGLVFFEGEWHLFYQYNPHGIGWGHMSWGHAVSRDLVRWGHLPVAIPEENGVMAFSGSAVVDWKNTGRFGKDGGGGAPPLVAIYTGHRVDGSNQSQFIASSTDRGRTWERFAGNPVLDEKLANFRDPKVCWDEKRGRWVMVVAVCEERKVRFYKSSDLKKWELMSEFGPAGSVEGVWECPDLFELAVEGEKPRTGGGIARKWVLVVSVSGGGPTGGNGVQYFVGEFDGERFVADDAGGPGSERGKVLWVDQGADFYAPQSWSDVPEADGRRVAIAWMVNGRYAGAVPTSPWRSAMTLPRELTLRKTDRGVVRLFQEPVKELEALRGEKIEIKKGAIEGVNMQLFDKSVKGELLEIAAKFRAGGVGAEKFGINVRVGANGEKTVIGYDTASGKMFIDRRKAGEVGFHQEFGSVHEAAIEMRDGMLSMRVFVDRSSVEVFANDGEAAMTELILPDPGSIGVEVWGESFGTLVEGMEVWRLKSVWR